MKTSTKKWLIGLALIAFSFSTLPSRADDIAVSDLPKAVTQAIEKRFPGAKLISAERERDKDKIHYEVKIQVGKDRKELNVRPNGTIYKIENEDDDD
ncbi:PepSY domain-containing protein [Spirosoma aerophilum]